MTDAEWAAKVARQYEAAIRRNRWIPDSWSLAPRRTPAPPGLSALAGAGRALRRALDGES